MTINQGKIRQILAIVIIVATLAVAGAIAMKAYRGMRGGSILPSLPKNIDVSLQKIHYTETKGGVKKWDLVAEKGEYDKVKEVVLLTGIRLDVAGAGKMGEIILTADRGYYHPKGKNVDLIGNIVAKTASGMSFTTGQATYLDARSMIHSPGRVKFTDGSLTVEGRGMEFLVETKKMKIMNEVTADFIPGTEKHEK